MLGLQRFCSSSSWAIALLASALVLASCGGVTSSFNSVTLATDTSAPQAGLTAAQRQISAPVRRLYSAGAMIWHTSDGAPKAKAKTLFRILKATSAHGLREDYYLPADLLAQDALSRVSPARARVVDRALTQALYEFAGDFRYGRYNPNRPGTSATLTSAVQSNNLVTWLTEHEPKGKSYIDLRNLLRGGALSPGQRSLVAMNMERLRWVPEAAYTIPTVRVNIADMTLEMFTARGRLHDTMRGVIGRAERETPILNDLIRDLKFSPDWTIPLTIIEKDILPKLKRNPRYLDPSKYEVRVKGVPPWQITDWSTVEPEDVFVRRASSGAGPLGGVRFSMYNKDAIFLHDTVAKGLFKRDFRAYSSGCVRVERAGDLAFWISSLQPDALSRDEITARMAAGDTTYHKLTVPVMANLQYMTVFVNGAGKTVYTGDPYKWDGPLAAKMDLVRVRSRTLAGQEPIFFDDPDFDLSP